MPIALLIAFILWIATVAQCIAVGRGTRSSAVSSGVMVSFCPSNEMMRSSMSFLYVGVVQRDVHFVTLVVCDIVFRYGTLPGSDLRCEVGERPLVVFEQRVAEIPATRVPECFIHVVQFQDMSWEPATATD